MSCTAVLLPAPKTHPAQPTPPLTLQVIDELINQLRGALKDLPAGSKVRPCLRGLFFL